VVEWLLERVAAAPDVRIGRGMSAANRFPVEGWELTVMQRFQFGDLRLEGPSTTVVVEVESAGGITNLVKFWPLLRAGRPQGRFVLVHIFRITSDADYIAHRRLWEFLTERMREDLSSAGGLTWPGDWEARQFIYRSPDDLAPAAEYIREVLL
jgi:hypothetical protein